MHLRWWCTFLMHQSCWCTNPADAPILLMRWSCWCADPADALILLMSWSCRCTDADDALVLLMYWCCWCADAIMLLNHDQDLLADLSIAICSSCISRHCILRECKNGPPVLHGGVHEVVLQLLLPPFVTQQLFLLFACITLRKTKGMTISKNFCKNNKKW